ncbi:translocation and assembly module lipoprotein TamL [Ulvibacter antarcticus]|uniref:Outer membrane protein assembly factor BamA n=1 Tax=Ulvibacter antarcticus TaxID=442714 RepID=A0A3L9YAF0_9FLAO|nr:BamA/TamA family outer membrane protein [Ulvibacter antarcticus]RMA57703.1 outer membrane protein assembly factor BamA [Ulvibacter antarcticus]
MGKLDFGSIYTKVIGLAILILLQACSIQKFIPEDELLYTGGTVDIVSDTILKNKSELTSVLEEVIRPKPNSKLLGMNLGLYYHYKSRKEKPGFLNKWLNKQLGQKPVYRSDVETFQVEELLRNRLENRGFFYSQASSDVIEDEVKKRASAVYTVKVPTPYRMATYQLDTLSPPIYKEMISSVATSKLKPGIRFNLAALKLERERIDGELKEKGYYNFNPGFLIFEADTNQYKNKRFDLFLKLKKDVPKAAILPYTIDKVNIYANYDLERDSLQMDITRFNEKNFIQENEFFKPKHLDPFITIEEGELYSPIISKNTARRLSTIGAYKFVNIQYKEIDSMATDSTASLEANIYLSPLNKRAVRAELQAVTKSNNFAGPAFGLTFSNRNFLKGGETLNTSANVGYEVQVAGGDQAGLTSIVLGAKSELIFPRVIAPFKINTDFFEYAIPKTKTGIGVEYLSRSQLYTLLSGTAQFGYTWNANRYVLHEINPISINYTRLLNTSPEFELILEENSFLQRSFEQQFISGLTYSFTYNGMVDTSKKHQIFLNTTFDIAGNSISLFGQQQEGVDSKTFLGTEYAQYAKVDADIRYHFNFGKDQKIATRLFAGYGYAYGNSEVLPFIKQYYSGGPYSVRAFRIRSLGPGTYIGDPDGTGTFFDQSGNIRLEANIEYRFPIFGFLKGAVFADAGNIWLSNENPQLPGGKFSSSFMSELGMGAGFGLRVDVQGFVIRFDLAAPFHDPALEENNRFDFRVDEPLLNFAIGYPF